MLPYKVRNSSILTGNDLGILANVQIIPNQQDIDAFWNCPEREVLKNNLKTIEDIHLSAKNHILKNEVHNAWCILLK